jgi:hypothetical protein
MLRDRSCDINIVNVRAQAKEKCDELERVFHRFPKNHMNTVLGDFKTKVVREDFLKPTIGNRSLHQPLNDNGVTVVTFETSVSLKYIVTSSYA